MVEIVKTTGVKSIPDGHYKFVVKSVDDEDYSEEKPTVICAVEIVQNRNKNLNGLKTIKAVSFKDNADNFLAEWLKGLGYSDKEMGKDNFKIDTDEWVGRMFEADYTKDGKYAVLENIKPVGSLKNGSLEESTT